MPLDLHIALAQGELLAGGDQNLLLHQVDTRDHFGNGMFDLNTRIHFYEEKLAIFVQEFEGAGATVIDLAAGLGATLADALDQAAGDARRGSFLDDFLVAALHGAIALAQTAGVATDRKRVGWGKRVPVGLENG